MDYDRELEHVMMNVREHGFHNAGSICCQYGQNQINTIYSENGKKGYLSLKSRNDIDAFETVRWQIQYI